MDAAQILAVAESAEEAHQMAQREQVRAGIPLSGDETLELCAQTLRERIRRDQAELHDIEAALEERASLRAPTVSQGKT